MCKSVRKVSNSSVLELLSDRKTIKSSRESTDGLNEIRPL